MNPEIALNDSGIRRLRRTWLAWFRSLIRWIIPIFVPMAPRKHRDTESDSQTTDKSIVAWRTFQTAALGYLVYLMNGGAPSENRTIERIDRRLYSLEEKVDRIDAQVQSVTRFAESFKNTQGAHR